MTNPFTLITMLCWLGGPPDYTQGHCDVKQAETHQTKNYLECVVRKNEYANKNQDPMWEYHGGTHKIAFCVENVFVDILLHDDQAFNVDQYAKIWAKGDVKTTYKFYE